MAHRLNSMALMKKPSARRVRYAVVGVGHIAQAAMLPAFQHAKENSELVAIVSSDEVKRRALTKKYGLELTGTYDELESVIQAGAIDAVYLATPNTLHREHVERSMAAGAHVLCEKPLAMTSKDCEAMASAAQKYERKLMVAYRLHFEEATIKALELVRGGKLGDIRFFSSAFSHQIREGDIRTKAELGGGALFDLGPYPLNAVRQLFEAEPVEVFAFNTMGVDARSEEVDEMTTAILRFEDGRTAQFTVSQGAASVSECRIVGTKGDLRLEPAFEYVDGLVHHLTVDEKSSTKRFSKRDQFAPELIEFSKCILENTEPEASIEEGLADVRVLEAIESSVKSRRPVTLAPFEREQRPERSQETRKPAVKKVKTVNAPSPSR